MNLINLKQNVDNVIFVLEKINQYGGLSATSYENYYFIAEFKTKINDLHNIFIEFKNGVDELIATVKSLGDNGQIIDNLHEILLKNPNLYFNIPKGNYFDYEKLVNSIISKKEEIKDIMKELDVNVAKIQSTIQDNLKTYIYSDEFKNEDVAYSNNIEPSYENIDIDIKLPDIDPAKVISNNKPELVAYDNSLLSNLENVHITLNNIGFIINNCVIATSEPKEQTSFLPSPVDKKSPTLPKAPSKAPTTVSPKISLTVEKKPEKKAETKEKIKEVEKKKVEKVDKRDDITEPTQTNETMIQINETIIKIQNKTNEYWNVYNRFQILQIQINNYLIFESLNRTTGLKFYKIIPFRYLNIYKKCIENIVSNFEMEHDDYIEYFYYFHYIVLIKIHNLFHFINSQGSFNSIIIPLCKNKVYECFYLFNLFYSILEQMDCVKQQLQSMKKKSTTAVLTKMTTIPSYLKN